ncbi:MAG: PqqD family protein [Nitrospiraceae bacterium]|nr:PqqD family protein [Nitrospiraceae bacterium]
MPMPAEILGRQSCELATVFPKRNEDVHGTNMDGEAVLLNLSTGRYYTLNPVGALIWDHCAGDRSIQDLLSLVCARFEVTGEQATRDLIELISALTQEGLIQTERR